MEDTFQENLSKVLKFLRSEGFYGAERSLIEELQGVLDQAPGSNNSPLSSDAPFGPGGSQEQPSPTALSPRTALALQLEEQALGETYDLGGLEPDSISPARPVSPQQVPWDEVINEYENQDDVGYERRDVVGQRYFMEMELDLQDLPESTGGSFSQQHHSQGNTSCDLGEEDSEDGDHSCGSSISGAQVDPGAVVDLMPTSSSGAHGASKAAAASGSKSRAQDDLAWDLGPIGIRIAEPVTTPTKTSSVVNADEPKPVLSRVESLSSSFKDFDIEGTDEDGLPSRRASATDQPAGDSSPGPDTQVEEAAAEVIDFTPSAPISTAASTASQLKELDDPIDLTPPSLDTQPDLKPPELDPTPASGDAMGAGGVVLAWPATSHHLPQQPSHEPDSNQATCPSSHQAEEEVPESGALGGGFSFPVTASATDAQPDHRIFKSWPSVRSSCTSEVIAASDDDHVAADYADDDYLRSKPTSRTASQNLSDLAKSIPRRPSITDEELPSSKSGYEGWSFAQAKQPATSSGGMPGDSTPLEPTAEAMESAHALQDPTASCISEPSTTNNYLTCLPQGLLQHMSAAAAEAVASADSPKQPPPTSKPPLSTQRSLPDADSPAAGSSPSPPATQDAAKRRSLPSQQQSASAPATAPGSPIAAAPALQATPGAKPAMSPKSAGKESGGGQGKVQVEQAAQQHSPGSAPSSGRRLSGTQVAALPPVLEMSGSHTGGSQASRVSSHVITPDSPPLSPRATAAGAGGELHEEQYHEARSRNEEEGEAEEGEEEDDLLQGDYDEDQGAGEDESGLDAAAALEWEQLPTQPEHEPDVASSPRSTDQLMPRFSSQTRQYIYDPQYIARKFDILSLKVYHRRNRTGFEETKDLPIRENDLIAGRYQVTSFLGSAAFSRAVQAQDIKRNMPVCLKIIKNNKDYFDQSLDEIKLLKYVNQQDPEDKFGVVRLYDYFYYKEHLFLVCELLRANLYDYQKHRRDNGYDNYFSVARIQSIARQVLRSLHFIHTLGLIHSDLKPENILIKNYARCEVKVIDLGSSCYVTDQLSSYVQSRSYRAPEVILGLPYDQKIDIWSLGCILAELSSGQVLFQNDSVATLLARLEGIMGPLPDWMIAKGRYAPRYYTRRGHLYEKSSVTGRYELLVPKRTSLRHRVPDADEGLLSFIGYLLHIDPHRRPSAAEALQHPWLHADLGQAHSTEYFDDTGSC